jgi:NAD(P)-dependent dehydrogenase (short-subunit alcohol dehydrogenase family)
MLSECLRAELASEDIGVTAVCPGFVNTNITSTARFTGVDEEEARRRQKRSARLYGLRNYPPEKVADAVLDAIVRNTAVAPVTPEARGAHFMSRFMPGVLRGIARVEPKL